ncbi:hypothetical protein V8F06_010384 [Rhypophila decipiens]
MSEHSQHVFSRVVSRIGDRVSLVVQTLLPFSLFGMVTGASTGNTDDPDSVFMNNTYIPRPSDDPVVISDVRHIIDLFDFDNYRQVGNAIRSGNREECFGNLSIVLGSLGPITAASGGGSSGALTLLPTAGALIGTPAKELWILYKLVPIAGVLSMLLSLGGNIVPNTTDEYEHDGYNYGGLIGTADGVNDELSHRLSLKNVNADTFAEVVRARAENKLGSSKRSVTAIGIMAQLFWISMVIFACWFTETGAVVVWWCQAWGWMLFWYVMVAGSSLLENVALVPFTQQWTIRVSKAPSHVEISADAPSVFSLTGDEDNQDSSPATFMSMNSAAPLNRQSPLLPKTNGAIDSDDIELGPLPTIRPFTRRETDKSARSVVEEYRNFTPHLTRQRSNFLHILGKHGFNTTGQAAYIDGNSPWSANRNSFLVILSVSGVSHGHAALRVVSKAVSVGCFAAGTATFASASLITISVALTALCLILGAGVFGRVASLWMVSEMMKENPVLHKVVHDEAEADKFISKMLATDGLIFETMGHVFINGRCVRRYNRWFNWATVFGILASPYRVDKMMMSGN